MRAFLYIVWILLIVAAVVHAEHYGKSITTDSAAVAAANEITGFGEYYAQRGAEPPIASVTPEVYRDSTTPFLHDSLDGLASWKVVYSDIGEVLEGLDDSGKVKRGATKLTLWLDSAQGRVLLCHIGVDGREWPETLIAPSDLEPIRRAGGNVFLGLPGVMPKLTLLDALAVWSTFSSGASGIVVRYVTLTKQGVDAFPAWNLVFPGVHMKPIDYENAIYAVDVWVDAESGKRSPVRQCSSPPSGALDQDR
jgi:hypothetical protein